MGFSTSGKAWFISMLCLTMMNRMMENLSNHKWRALLGRYIFGLTETE